MLVFVGIARHAQYWFPVSFGDLNWEMNLMVRFFDGMAVIIIGIVALASWAITQEREGALKGVQWLSLAFAAVSILLLGLVAVRLPGMSAALRPADRSEVFLGLFRSGVMGVVYLGFLLWAARKLATVRHKPA